MATMTDPAQELGEIASRLTSGSNKAGALFLADQFMVEAWSTDFYRILTCIVERADLVSSIISRSTLDVGVKRNALEEVEQFKSAFTLGPLSSAWNNSGHGLSLMKDHGRPIQYLSPTVRAEVSYPKLTKEEVAELVSLIDAYLASMDGEGGPEFVRQAIRDGLSRFRFQLMHIGWMGSGYVLATFREVMFVYQESQRQFTASEIDERKALSGLWAILKQFKVTIDTAKDWTDTGDSLWKAYQLTSAFATPFLLTWTGGGGG
jgi:hypothetical protein